MEGPRGRGAGVQGDWGRKGEGKVRWCVFGSFHRACVCSGSISRGVLRVFALEEKHI